MNAGTMTTNTHVVTGTATVNNLSVSGASTLGNVSTTGSTSLGNGTFVISQNGDLTSNGAMYSAGPMRDGCYDFLPTTHAQIQAFADSIVSNNSNTIPNLFVGYGNAKDASYNVVVSGKQSNGGSIPADPYIRLTSLAKNIGVLVSGKMMADGWINMDTPIAAFLGNGWFDASGIAHGDMIPDSSGNIPRDASGQYIKPWLSKNRTIMDSSGVIRTMQAAYTAWAAAQSPPFVSNATLNPCPNITVLNCLNHTAGLSYDYYTVGRLSDLNEYAGDRVTLNRVKQFGVGDYLSVYATGQPGSTFPDPSNNYNANPANAPRLLVDSSGNTTYTSDDYLSLMSTQPVSSLPGLFSEYGRGYDLLGYFLDQVIKQTPTLSALYTDVIDYAKKTILTPIGITDAWVYGGESPAPADVETRMLSASIQRSSRSEIGGKSTPYGLVDTSQNGLVSVTGVPVAKYAYTDASGFTFTGYFDSSNNSLTVWADAVPGDTNTIGYNQLYYRKTKNTNLKHIGILGSAWCMSVGSYCKLLRFIANKGYDVVSKRRIMPKSVFTYGYQSSVTESAWTGVTDYEKFNSAAPMEVTYAYGTPLVWSFGSYKFVELASVEYKGLAFITPTGTVNANFINQPPLYPFAPGAHTWAGVMNIAWYMDPESGNYVLYGTQAASWASAAPSLFQSRRSTIRADPPGPNPAYLGAAPVNSTQNTNYALSRLVSILMDSDTD